MIENINQLIQLIKGASRSEATKLAAAFKARGVPIGGDKDSGDKAPSGVSKEIASAQQLLESLTKPTEKVLNSFEEIYEKQKSFREETKNYFKAGFTGQMYDFSTAIDAANKASVGLTGNLESGRRVNEAWRTSTKLMAFVGRDFQKTLMQTSVVLDQAGFDMRDYAEIVDSAAFAFNSNEDQIKKLTATLVNVQKEIPVSGRELSENFRFAQKNFAYSADKMMDNFIGLQKMSTTTGISFGSLTSAFGESMDSFQGSANKAGKLNQILGKSAFNSMELLTMTETERATKVRKAIMSSGRSIEDMGKFELLALKDTIGLGSVEETRKFLRGDLKIDEKKSMKAIESRDPVALKSKSLKQTMTFLEDSFNKVRPATDMLALQLATVNRGLAGLALNQIDVVKDLKAANMPLTKMLETASMVMAGMAKRDKTGGILRDPADISGVVREMNPLIKKMSQEIGKLNDKKDLGAADYAKIAAGMAAASNLRDRPMTTMLITQAAEAFSSALAGQKLEVTLKTDGKATARLVTTGIGD